MKQKLCLKLRIGQKEGEYETYKEFTLFHAKISKGMC